MYMALITRPVPAGIRAIVERIATIQFPGDDAPMSHAALRTSMRDIHALLCFENDIIDQTLLDTSPHLRVISTASGTFDHINLRAASMHGITVCHAPGAADRALADFSFGLLLAVARNIVQAHHFVMNGLWDAWSPTLFQGADIHGKTLGIIGLGNVGMQVAHRAQGFGMRVLYTDQHRHQDAEQRMGLEYGSLENLLREADFVTLHVSLTSLTRDMLTTARLRMMKPTAYLINMARGAVVKHDALVQALREGWIAGAALDIYNDEMLPADDPLLSLPNVVLTPHLGANTRRAQEVMQEMAAQQIVQVLRGQYPEHPVILPEHRHEAA